MEDHPEEDEENENEEVEAPKRGSTGGAGGSGNAGEQGFDVSALGPNFPQSMLGTLNPATAQQLAHLSQQIQALQQQQLLQQPFSTLAQALQQLQGISANPNQSPLFSPGLLNMLPQQAAAAAAGAGGGAALPLTPNQGQQNILPMPTPMMQLPGSFGSSPGLPQIASAVNSNKDAATPQTPLSAATASASSASATSSSSSPPSPSNSQGAENFQTNIPFQPATSTVQHILNNIVGKVKLFMLTLEHIRQTQKHVLDLQPMDCAANLEGLSRQHKELYDAMLHESATLTRLYDDVVLSPAEIFHTKKLQLQLQKYLKQLDLYQLELMYYVRPDTVPCPAALIITDQPFSRSIVKGQMVPIEAQLLLPSRLDIRSMGRVTADVVQYHSTKKGGKSTGPYLENATEDLDAEGKVRLHLRFPIGTNKKPVTLRLHVNIKHGPMKCHNPAISQPGMRLVESNQSKPFIITTNSIQWRDSEGILLKMETFGDMMEISWARFANTVHSFYLTATRQHTEFPARPLTLKDFEYLSTLKFDRNNVVNLQAFDRFWEWFGPGLEKIRHQKNLCPMWIKGYIYGFISKADCDSLLANHEDGTFVVRFSDRFAGKYSAAYVFKGEVHHSLIKDTDSSGNKRTLVDFLHEVDNVRVLLQFKSDFQGKVQLNKIAKEEILQEFFTEKQESRTPGYEEFPRPASFSFSTSGTSAASPTSPDAAASPASPFNMQGAGQQAPPSPGKGKH
eukprot:TRINITY_DN6915_c0_g1_i1.p1 TRINITY_DN6915_c0_g1~~TRINITY_DN6915_c0_g1_i1.p1  ORF type:complete len:770 (-),score=235.43 TRINITY_DN6915_c0_g1_i1:117-2318(-)